MPCPYKNLSGGEGQKQVVGFPSPTGEGIEG